MWCVAQRQVGASQVGVTNRTRSRQAKGGVGKKRQLHVIIGGSKQPIPQTVELCKGKKGRKVAGRCVWGGWGSGARGHA